MARANHPGFACDMARYVGAANGNIALVGGQATTGSASDTIVTGLASVAGVDRKSTRLNSSHIQKSRMPSSA